MSSFCKANRLRWGDRPMNVKAVRVTASAVASAILLLASQCCASVIYSLDQANYDLQPGGTVAIPVYLTFTGTDAAELTAGGGLSSAAVKLMRTGAVPTSPTCPTAVSANAVDFTDTLLGPQYIAPTATQVGVWEFVDLNSLSGVAGKDMGDGSRRIQLGTFLFRAGSVLNEVTTFQAVDYDPNLDNTVTFTVPTKAFDASIEPVVVSFTVVPEPTAIGLIVLGSLAVPLLRTRSSRLCTYWRSRRRPS